MKDYMVNMWNTIIDILKYALHVSDNKNKIRYMFFYSKLTNSLSTLTKRQ